MNQPLSFSQFVEKQGWCVFYRFVFNVDACMAARGGRRMGMRGFVVATLGALLLCTTAVSGVSSGISFLETTTLSEADGSAAVTINPEQTYLASGYDDHMSVMWLNNLTVITTIDLDRPVQTLEFSPDGSMLAVAISGSETDIDTIQIFDVETMSLTGKQQTANARPIDIAWSPDGALLAVPNSNSGVDLIRVSDMVVDRSLSNEHNTDITCTSFSKNGAHILTGDESGRMVMWNVDGTPTSKKWELNHEVTSCEFDSTETRIAALTVEGSLNTMSFAGGALQNANFESGGGMEWSTDATHLHFVVPSPEPTVITLDASTFEVVTSTAMAHQVLDIAYTENQYGMIEDLYVATDTLHLAHYGHHSLPDGYGEAGADLDGDGVPDTLDTDDDGDAIFDQWDTYCPLGNEECSRSPDPEHIRSLNVVMNETHMVITDRIKLDIVLSSSIRNMSRTSVIQDTQLSQSEADLFASSVCHNLDKPQMIDQWKDSIILSEGQLTDGTVECRVSEGMTFRAQNDFKTHIGFEYQITFNRSSTLSYPMVVTFDEQTVATDASLTHLAEMHPIHIQLSAKGADDVELSPWWTTESPLELTLEERFVKEPTLTQKGVQLFSDYPILFLVVLGILGVGVLVVLRTKNTMGMDLNIFDEEEDEDTHGSTDEEGTMYNSTSETGGMDEDNEPHSEKEPEVETSSSDGAAPFQTGSLPQTSEPPKRRSRKQPPRRDGPITTVKRKRLDESGQQEIPKKRSASKKKVIVKDAPVRKTRRVVTHSDTDENDSPSEG